MLTQSTNSAVANLIIFSFFANLVAVLMGAPWGVAMLLMIVSWPVMIVLAIFFEVIVHPKALVHSVKRSLKEEAEIIKVAEAKITTEEKERIRRNSTNGMIGCLSAIALISSVGMIDVYPAQGFVIMFFSVIFLTGAFKNKF